MAKKRYWGFYIDIKIFNRPFKANLYLMTTLYGNPKPMGDDYLRVRMQFGRQGDPALVFQSPLTFFLKKECFEADKGEKFKGEMLLSNPDDPDNTTVDIKCSHCGTVYHLVHR